MEEICLRRPVLEAHPLSERKALVAALLDVLHQLDELGPNRVHERGSPSLELRELLEFLRRRRFTDALLDVAGATEGGADGGCGYVTQRDRCVWVIAR